MKLTTLVSLALGIGLLSVPVTAKAQSARAPRTARSEAADGYASVILEPAYTDEDYSQNIVQTLRKKYHLTLAGASRSPIFEWIAIDAPPPGLTIDSATGQIFGSPGKARPQPYLFRLHVVDRSVANPSPLKLRLSLKIMAGPRPGPAPTLQPAAVTAQTSGEQPGATDAAVKSEATDGDVDNGVDANTQNNDDVEIPTIVPRKELVLPLTIKNPAIRQIEVLVKNDQGEVIDRDKTPDDLPRGEVRTSVKVSLQEGDNILEVRNADDADVLYKEIRLTLKATDVDTSGLPDLQLMHSGLVTKEAQVTPIKIVVKNPKIKTVNLTVESLVEGQLPEKLSGYPEEITLRRGQDDYPLIIPVATKPNSVTRVTITAGDDHDKSDQIEITRATPSDIPPVAVNYSGFVSEDVTSVPLQITVNDPKISKLKVIVTPKGKEAEVADQAVVRFRRGENTALQEVRIPASRDITVKINDVSAEANPENEEVVGTNIETIEITRRRGDTPLSTIITNSQNTRAIVGFEQTGASAADSESKPFLDFFFTAPLRFKPQKDELPRVSAWGQVRLAALPRQLSTFGTFPSNFVNPLTEGKLVDLVQGFDFLSGLEVRVFGTDKPYVSLIPGIKNQTFFHFVAGGGAISPLTTTRSTAQIFAVPGDESPQLNLFKQRYGEEAAKKDFIAFVFPDRDRFLRQFYFGVRFKTFYYEDNRTTPINRFPAIFDFMIGQNEAVSGGRLKNDVTDANGRIIGRKRSWVLRLEAFYPFPIKEASFLYLYGTAMMKIGGGGVRIDTPLFLDTAPGNISITDNNVFVAPTLQTNRDYYRFGIGINLTDLFNRRRSPEDNDER